MIISRTPFRISFFGGGTDYPAWYGVHGGTTLSTTISKYCYISCRWLPPFFDYTSRISWSKIELVRDHSEIQHPAVRAVLEHLAVRQGIEMHHQADLPARTGLGSSSAFTVGLLHALKGLQGIMPSKMQLAQEAIHVEQTLLKEHVGSQDQVATSFGGFNRIDFARDNAIQVTPVLLDRDRLIRLQGHLVLIYTGVSRTASEIAQEQIRITGQRTQELKAMRQMVDEAIRILQDNADLEEFGQLLHESWLLKRSLTCKISTPLVDQIYDSARRAGAIGGKLLGAGGGGFLLLFVRPEEQERVGEAVNGLLRVPFHFENSGSRIIFYDPDSLHSSAEEKGHSPRELYRPLEPASGAGHRTKESG